MLRAVTHGANLAVVCSLLFVHALHLAHHHGEIEHHHGVSGEPTAHDHGHGVEESSHHASHAHSGHHSHGHSDHHSHGHSDHHSHGFLAGHTPTGASDRNQEADQQTPTDPPHDHDHQHCAICAILSQASLEVSQTQIRVSTERLVETVLLSNEDAVAGVEGLQSARGPPVSLAGQG
ncbi:MAG: hypothetical protein KDA96_02225 [Planctomycetaceae bacterium]|nr:hypothetical protein [Planctomycetaceae bacterium]